jgi:hypothetical protein
VQTDEEEALMERVVMILTAFFSFLLLFTHSLFIPLFYSFKIENRRE